MKLADLNIGHELRIPRTILTATQSKNIRKIFSNKIHVKRSAVSGSHFVTKQQCPIIATDGSAATLLPLLTATDN
jgi:hypothetical protein